jgi:hypothetical protein
MKIKNVKMIGNPTGLQDGGLEIIFLGGRKVDIQFFTNPGEGWTPIDGDRYEGKTFAFPLSIRGVKYTPKKWEWDDEGNLVVWLSLSQKTFLLGSLGKTGPISKYKGILTIDTAQPLG